ncbi:thioesterase [Mesorhizobium sp. M3A.F.Ca.ET.080.04.2.1]|uniref:acyl-CoA thioesterase n=1 Tax=Mesorhizobium sp. M3A.F.Ca.ET.080.04.2.1 TaxID=2493676 RepID=UPI000F75507A|nr:thioesterase family protein [Mesorhizobium sp. M3A.F.Ca.ET.080.04.2.1]AZO07912.1 thioesterase [Mesorhizobium sp. M3A.F.Ca.ET.080.04.2.1]RWF13117.1 MAG: thioesterase [Mesorhizobium sp.]
MSIPSPFISESIEIQSEWCGGAGQLGNAYYNVVFDRGAEGAFESLGLGTGYARRRGLSFYTAEAHVCFVRPLHAGDRVVVKFQILDFDEKRIRSYQEIHHLDGWLAATTEVMSLHVDLDGPRVVPFPHDVKARLDAMAAAHATLPLPERAGRHIELS